MVRKGGCVKDKSRPHLMIKAQPVTVKIRDEVLPDILPCPFCGSKASFGISEESYDSNQVENRMITCSNKKCRARIYHRGLTLEAIKKWNTRSTSVQTLYCSRND